VKYAHFVIAEYAGDVVLLHQPDNLFGIGAVADAITQADDFVYVAGGYVGKHGRTGFKVRVDI
jgi:predicted oxidoreductase